MSDLLTAPKAKKPFRGSNPGPLSQPLPIPIASLTEVKADNSIWRWYEGTLNDSNLIEVAEDSSQLEKLGFFGTRKSDLDPEKYVEVTTVTPKLNHKVEKVQQKKTRQERREMEEESNLTLDPEEAFFLSYALGCLVVTFNKKKMNLDEMWDKFCEMDSGFPFKYFTYHHFRAKGWVTRNGVKFGSDFLLYKHGPPFYHASYCVKVVVEDEFQSWRDLAGTNRVVESAGKELLLARIQLGMDKESVKDSIENLRKMTLSEILVRRWVPEHEREQNVVK